MSAAEEKTESAPAASAAPSGGSKLVLILTGVNVLATLGMVGLLFISFQKEKKGPSVEDIAAHSATAEGHEGSEGKKEGDEHGGGHAAEGGGHGEAAHGEGGHGEKTAEKKPVPETGKMVTLEQFTVNLSTPGSVNPKFVRANISIEAPNDDTASEVTSKMPQVRNLIIDLFNSKRPSDLATGEGRDYLKEEIRNAINGVMVTGKVKGVFFTSFALSS